MAPTSSGALERITCGSEFMVEGWMVMVTTHVKEQGYGREGLEAKLQAIELLSEARETHFAAARPNPAGGHRRGVGGRVHRLGVGPSGNVGLTLKVRRRQKARHAQPQFACGTGRRVRGQARGVVHSARLSTGWT